MHLPETIGTPEFSQAMRRLSKEVFESVHQKLEYRQAKKTAEHMLKDVADSLFAEKSVEAPDAPSYTKKVGDLIEITASQFFDHQNLPFEIQMQWFDYQFNLQESRKLSFSRQGDKLKLIKVQDMTNEEVSRTEAVLALRKAVQWAEIIDF